jgi:hypothetical protein
MIETCLRMWRNVRSRALCNSNVRKCQRMWGNVRQIYLTLPNVTFWNSNVRQCQRMWENVRQIYLMSANVGKCETDIFNLNKMLPSNYLMSHFGTVHRTFCHIPPYVRMSANVRKCRVSILHRTVRSYNLGHSNVTF